ncbi:SPARC-related modular calcium-binding protein 1 [Atta colombica]|uniref:SPARC-related modular calcium-binding protein 1 n=1 Tax=Atta colombica TaxID=520822 RepID=A0A151HYL0_9HYME|nr:SPARC-related modular calcium-binding protein 1 [Atta colombica]
MYWAEEGQQLVYITPILLEKRPAICHDRRNPSVTALKLMRFIYLSDYEALEQHLYKLHTYATMVPSVLLIDELDDYLLSDEAPGDNNSCIAKICALILHSMNLCSRILEKNEECRKRIAECTMNGGGSTPVCGSDGVTYSNQCQVISKQCQGVSVLIKHTGPCPETPACFSARLTARHGVRPACRDDGTYAPVQCHAETEYCWCVTPQGRPLPDTTVRYKKPRCLRAGSRSAASTRSGQRRRSPTRKQRRQYVSNRHRNTCDRTEKSKFNGNLIENFKIEYRRTNISAEDDKNVERVLSWKFLKLDQNADGYLDKTEYKELRRLAKKAVRPKKCARTFARTCDLNRDLKLSKQEWGACLANDFTRENNRLGSCPLLVSVFMLPHIVYCHLHRFFIRNQILIRSPAIGSPIQSLPFNDDHSDTKEESDVIIYISSSTRNLHSLSPIDNSTPYIDTVQVMYHNVSKQVPMYLNTNDCISDRRSVLEDQKRENLYVPQCMSDGRYHRVQCYSGYCWCVYQDTGKPIPGTSSKDRTPNCNPVPTPSRPMKGCPELKKQLFLRDLMTLMQEKMEASNIDSNETTVKWQASKEERIATWHFVMLDKNKNKVLEKKEWKNFRTMVANNRQLRRCGKKLPRYCDINNDRRISMTEWLSCLNAQRPTIGNDPEKPLTIPKRIGPNPLDQFLNDDD